MASGPGDAATIVGNNSVPTSSVAAGVARTPSGPPAPPRGRARIWSRPSAKRVFARATAGSFAMSCNITRPRNDQASDQPPGTPSYFFGAGGRGGGSPCGGGLGGGSRRGGSVEGGSLRFGSLGSGSFAGAGLGSFSDIGGGLKGRGRGGGGSRRSPSRPGRWPRPCRPGSARSSDGLPPPDWR